MTPTQDAANSKEIDDVLTFLALCERGFGTPAMSFYDGALLAMTSTMDSMIRAACRGHTAKEFDYDREAIRLGDFSGSVVLSGDPERYAIVGARTMDLVAKQRIASILKQSIVNDSTGETFQVPIDPLSKIIELRSVAVSESGYITNLNHNYYARGRFGKKIFCPVLPESRVDKVDWGSGHTSYESLAFATSILWAVAAEQAWRVYISFRGVVPGVSFFTDPTGVKEFFKFRDVQEGKTRRDALLNWVTHHWRQTRDDPEVEVYVREYLRGAREFEWHGLNVKILLPRVEIDREIGAIEGRKRLKAAQLDKRAKQYNQARDVALKAAKRRPITL